MVSNVRLLRGVQECDPGAREATRETGKHAHFKKEPTSAREGAEIGRSSRPLTLYLQATDPIAITSIYDNPSTADLMGRRAPAMRATDAPLNHIAGVFSTHCSRTRSHTGKSCTHSHRGKRRTHSRTDNRRRSRRIAITVSGGGTGSHSRNRTRARTGS